MTLGFQHIVYKLRHPDQAKVRLPLQRRGTREGIA